eukprot:9474305-Pyramimonas_sp.AAC.1
MSIHRKPWRRTCTLCSITRGESIRRVRPTCGNQGSAGPNCSTNTPTSTGIVTVYVVAVCRSSFVVCRLSSSVVGRRSSSSTSSSSSPRRRRRRRRGEEQYLMRDYASAFTTEDGDN